MARRHRTIGALAENVWAVVDHLPWRWPGVERREEALEGLDEILRR